MPVIKRGNVAGGFPTLNYQTFQSFKRGVVTLIDKSRLPKDALEDAENIFLVEDGQPAPRPGVDWYGSELPNAAAIEGVEYFDYAGAIHLVAAGGGKIYRSTNNGTTWTECTIPSVSPTYTTGSTVYMNQYNNKLYISNGVNNLIMYDGTTTLTQYGTLATPAAPTFVKTGLSGTAEQYYYKCAAVNAVGYSTASAATSVVQTSIARDGWDDTTNYVTLTLPTFVSGQVRYDIYCSIVGGTDNSTYYYIGSTTNTTFKDNGSSQFVTSTTAPNDSTASGPKVKILQNVGNRMYGVQDVDHAYRIWFSSGSEPYGAFTTGAGGGWLEWQPGGKFKPTQVADYRDGKGTPVASIWCKSADGQGCLIQMTLDEMTVGDVVITVPSAFKLPGSRGTTAPRSVVNVLNDYFFYNSQAIYNIGTRAQILNILSTDEFSANIRPTVRSINTAAEADICAVYYDAKVFFSVPIDSSTNNYTMIFDTERKAWIPKAFTIGFNKFLKYTDTSGNQHLLAYKPGDKRLSRIANDIDGDYGVPFVVTILTALIPVNRNRAEFQFLEQAEIELSRAQGDITVELLGFDRSKGFTSLKAVAVKLASGLSPYGWDSALWDTALWDDTTLVKKPFSESSIWRYFTIQKEVRAIQWKIKATSIDAYFILRTLQTSGTETQGGHPRQERLT